MPSQRAPGADPRRRRFAAIDVLRGGAIAAMVVYHLSWDLSAYGVVAVDVVNDPGWKAFARLIAGTFLALVGFNLVLGTRHGFRRGAYLRRLAIVAGAAALVSLGTWIFMPDDFVYFGILHAIAVASVLAFPFLRAPAGVAALASVFFLVGPEFLAGEFFDAAPLLWLGLSAHPQASVDFVPVFPWFGVVLGGLVLGRLFVDYGGEAALARWQPTARFWRIATFVGRWSLPIYLVHQPIMIGAIYLTTSFIGVTPETLAGRFINQCAVTCRSGGDAAEVCTASCTCLLAEMQRADIVENVLSGRLTDAEAIEWRAVLDRCVAAPPGG